MRRVHCKQLTPRLLRHAYLLSQLVIEKSLAALPRRKTDNAIIIQAQDNDLGKAKVFKLNAKPSDPVILERYARAFVAFLSMAR